jgi:hypothetical protein
MGFGIQSSDRRIGFASRRKRDFQVQAAHVESLLSRAFELETAADAKRLPAVGLRQYLTTPVSDRPRMLATAAPGMSAASALFRSWESRLRDDPHALPDEAAARALLDAEALEAAKSQAR